MPDLNERIEQFRKMANDDPNNELGHFSLGRALLDAGQLKEAAQSFQRVIALNPNIGKAYQLLAEAQLKQEQRELAIETLKTGARTAHGRGDMMPKNDMLKILKELGEDMPEFTAAAAADVKVGEGEVFDRRTGRAGKRLPAPPFSNKLGRFIFEHTSAESWREWIGMGTKVINELRLPLNDPQAQKLFDEHMLEFLNLKDLWEEEKKKP
jgi:Fe-S cluster biosynthesis and repair protein YggX